MNGDEIKGFYYDHQMMNPLYTISLHPNTRPVLSEDEEKMWSNDLVNQPDLITQAIGKKIGRSNLKHYDSEWDNFLTGGYTGDNKGTPNDGYLPAIETYKPRKGNTTQVDLSYSRYYAEPICTSLFTEDFNFSINNEWSNFDGGNAIEDLFKGMKPMAPFLDKIGDAIPKALETMQGDGSFGSSIVSTIGGWAKSLGGLGKKISTNMNKALYIQGTRFSMYNGSSTAFGSLNMRFTILSDWKPLYPGSSDVVFMTVYDQLNRIYPYWMGVFEHNVGGLGLPTEVIKSFGSETLGKELDNFVDEMVGWQSPPAGFRTVNKNIDIRQKGTLRMVFGGYYTLDNLVIRNVNVSVSRQLCKHPITGNTIPLYADVQIDLTPASVYTDRSVARILNNSGMQEIIANIDEAREKQEAVKQKKNEEIATTAKQKTDNALNKGKELVGKVKGAITGK